MPTGTLAATAHVCAHALIGAGELNCSTLMVSKLLVLLLLITSATIITATLDENLAQTFAQFKKAPADAGAKLAKLLRVRLGVTTAAELLAIAYSSSGGARRRSAKFPGIPSRGGCRDGQHSRWLSCDHRSRSARASIIVSFSPWPETRARFETLPKPSKRLAWARRKWSKSSPT